MTSRRRRSDLSGRAKLRSPGRPAPALSGRYLSFAEREQIALLRAKGNGVREIARELVIAANRAVNNAIDTEFTIRYGSARLCFRMREE